MTITLLQLRTAARQRADMVSSQFVTDAELTGYVNSSYAELYDLLTETFQDYYITLATVSVSAQAGSVANNTISLPADFYKMRGLDLIVDSQTYYNVRRTNWEERNRWSQPTQRGYYGLVDVRYILLGQQIYLVPEAKAAGTYRLSYVPRVTPLVLDTDAFDDIQNWSEYITVDCAIKMLQKEETDVSVLMAQKEALRHRITLMGQDRDAGSPETISDSQSSERDDWLPFPR